MAINKRVGIEIDGNIPVSFYSTCSLTDEDFARLSEFIETNLGVKMPPVKKQLLESRLQKRLRALHLSSFSEYCDFVFSPEGMKDELVHMIDLVTTHKTEFFREAGQFDFLQKVILPDLVTKYNIGISSPLTIWSAGCSTGEEPYTIAMVLSEFKETCPKKGFDFLIIASDISQRVLEIGRRGIYEDEKIAPIPLEYRKKYLLKSKDRSRGLVRFIPALREKIRFRVINFMDTDFCFREPLNIIFCRNVMIYFDKPTQERLFMRFYHCLQEGGFLFIGHSETMSNMSLPYTRVANSIYRKA
ncbi:MAG: CheR family methyltransferase [Thermodesulfovibrionales bacterium]